MAFPLFTPTHERSRQLLESTVQNCQIIDQCIQQIRNNLREQAHDNEGHGIDPVSDVMSYTAAIKNCLKMIQSRFVDMNNARLELPDGEQLIEKNLS